MTGPCVGGGGLTDCVLQPVCTRAALRLYLLTVSTRRVVVLISTATNPEPEKQKQKQKGRGGGGGITH